MKEGMLKKTCIKLGITYIPRVPDCSESEDDERRNYLRLQIAEKREKLLIKAKVMVQFKKTPEGRLLLLGRDLFKQGRINQKKGTKEYRAIRMFKKVLILRRAELLMKAAANNELPLPDQQISNHNMSRIVPPHIVSSSSILEPVPCTVFSQPLPCEVPSSIF
mmetsp:Transcript_27487/g.40604  ORF Transcript_27487/g.40604 Transcript_27487/m.40604 type:complete len:163 (-) Transcript_27487:48-536(-)|eukprot:CAMPEP_0194203902 /NCGR_PEP_ID=MMETSP0156-20130528/3557_1 /TAXON_ID=33649 /ORGANISM="Thalassionema nitzschioides, Strain L26-B" /LENGTH=162 /DNA_ID=CAMNT_0038929755 /DNA_START=88 /DNA_END=576 /DNA_ORIENTATION=+